MRELGKTLIFAGLTLAALGLLLYFQPRRLPGDILYRGRHTTVYFPVVTCLLLSAGLSLVFWIVSLFRR